MKLSVTSVPLEFFITTLVIVLFAVPAFVIVPLFVNVAVCPVGNPVQLPPDAVNALPSYVLLSLVLVHVVAFAVTVNVPFVFVIL